MDGVQGPEVTFMGKSLPLMTGILPGVAGVLGARRGVKRGLEKLGKSGAMDQELKNNLYAQRVREKVAEANKNNQSIDAKDYKSPAKAERAARARRAKTTWNSSNRSSKTPQSPLLEQRYLVLF